MSVEWFGTARAPVGDGEYVTLIDSGLLICHVPRGELLNGVCRLGSLGRFHVHKFKLFDKETIVLVQDNLCGRDSNLKTRMEVAIRRFFKLRDMINIPVLDPIQQSGDTDTRMIEL